MKLTANEVLAMHPVKRARVQDWIREQGLDPDHVRMLRIVGPQILVEEYVTDEHGAKQVHPDDSDRAWTRHRWVRRQTAFPELATIGDGS